MKKSIVVPRTAHYYLKGNTKADHVLYVLHGYAQLAEDFIKEFAALENENVLIIAPEALSKFYNKERKPVANWMTSHEREDEMKDYIVYLEQLRTQVEKDYGPKQLHILGFSQGTSTALRWISKCEKKIDHAYICSGAIPPELKEDDLKSQSECNFHYFYGDQDHFFNKEKGHELFLLLDSITNRTEEHPFEGDHSIHLISIEVIKSKIN